MSNSPLDQVLELSSLSGRALFLLCSAAARSDHVHRGLFPEESLKDVHLRFRTEGERDIAYMVKQLSKEATGDAKRMYDYIVSSSFVADDSFPTKVWLMTASIGNRHLRCYRKTVPQLVRVCYIPGTPVRKHWLVLLIDSGFLQDRDDPQKCAHHV